MAEQEMQKTETKLNLNAIKKSDRYVVRILDNASQVALYKFKPETQAWEKTEVEGAFFVYLRSSHPKYAFFIMNRLNMSNAMEPVTGDMEFKLQEPFLLYRNKTRDIFGIWFYDISECRRLGDLLNRLCRESQEKGPIPAPSMPSPQEVFMQQPAQNPAGESVDIMSLFAKAQERYDKQQELSQGIPTPTVNHSQEAVPRNPEQENEQEKFYQQNQQNANHLQQLLQGKSPSQTKTRANSSPAQYIMPHTQGLMSIPQHFLERATDRTCQPTENIDPMRETLRLPLDTVKDVKSADVQKLARGSAIEASANTKLPTQRKLFQHDKAEALGSPVSHNTTSVQPTVAHKDSPKRLSEGTAVSTSLMSPMAFQTSASSAPQQPKQPQQRKLDISPLTQDQLAQALVYLLKNDSEFVSKIHKAYVESLHEKLPT